MYNDDWTMPPSDEAEMWATFADVLDAIAYDISLTVETAEDALTDELHLQEDGSVNRNTLSVIRYRGISEENDQREHYLGMANELLPVVREDINLKLMSPQFVQRWGQLLFCHGYVVSHILDDGDHIAADRARHVGNRSKATRASQRKVFTARVLLRFMRDGASRKVADHRAAKAIDDLLTRTSASMPEVERSWWVGLLAEWPVPSGSDPQLASPLRQKHFADRTLGAHASAVMVDLPSLEVLFPKT